MNTISQVMKLYRASAGGALSRKFSSYPRHELVGMPSLSPTMTAGASSILEPPPPFHQLVMK